MKALRIGDLLKARRKPILMASAAVVVALSGLQLGRDFMGDAVETAASDAPPTAERRLETAALGGAEFAGAPEEGAAPGPAAAPGGAADHGKAAAPEEAIAKVVERPVVRKVVAGTAPSGEGVAEAGEVPVVPAPVEPAATDSGSAAAEAEPAAQVEKAAPAPVPEAAQPPVGQAPAATEVPAEAGPLALRQAASAGDPRALYEIASRYAEGRGTREDLAEAARWYEKAADLGHAPAQFRIGNFYEKGLGVPRDIAKSKTWYQLAAAEGNASAMHNLAVLHAMGADGATDNEAAARWFMSAAELGVKDSQFNLGILTAKGVGIPQDLEESYKWFALVAEAGDGDAAGKRDEIANALEPEQLERARAATRLWKPKALDPAANSVDIPDEWKEDREKSAGIDMMKAVRNVQLILNRNGFDAGTPDGVIGSRTKSAIVRFQEENGMRPTGRVDEELVRTLMARK